MANCAVKLHFICEQSNYNFVTPDVPVWFLAQKTEGFSVKWDHIVIWHAVFGLFSRNVPYLLNFSEPL